MDVYKKLALHLDNLPPGYPATESGVELRILKRLFSPEEAELALHLNLLAEEAQVIAHRANLPVEITEKRLEEMVDKGLIYCVRRRDKPTLYQIVYFAIGIWEFQVNRLNEGLISDVDEYFAYIFDHGMWETSPQLRTIPVGESIPVTQEVMIYEQAEAIIKAQDRILVAPCICRKERKMVGEGCDKPVETCLIFNTAADFYYHKGMGRMISQDEALQVLSTAEEAGLVLQPANSQQAGGMCCCCGDCCGVLRNLNRMEKPARLVVTSFQARHDPDLCAACGICVTRCQMHAIVEQDGVYTLDVDRCIGCGLCVTTCTTGALTLERKLKSESRPVPRTTVHNALRMWRNRGRLDAVDLLKMGAQSQIDRLLR